MSYVDGVVDAESDADDDGGEGERVDGQPQHVDDAHHVDHGEEDAAQDEEADVQVGEGDEHHDHDAEQGQGEVGQQFRRQDLLNLPRGVNGTV